MLRSLLSLKEAQLDSCYLELALHYVPYIFGQNIIIENKNEKLFRTFFQLLAIILGQALGYMF